MSFPTLIERARTHADRIAFRSETGSCTYEDLLNRSGTIAAKLLNDSGDLRESRVAMLIPPGVDYAAVQWGIWRAGGVVVPLSMSATERELDYALTDSQASTVVTTVEQADRLREIGDRRQVIAITGDSLDEPSLHSELEIDSDRRAMILYTSGTTSKPKGVVSTHACIEAQIRSLIEAWNWRPDDSIPLFLPLHHIHGIINVMSCALWVGGRLESFPRFDVNAVFRGVAEHRYSLFMAVPTIYVKMIETLSTMSADQRDPVTAGFARMRLMVSGSAALPASVYQQWLELTGQRLLERYGMTEIGMALSNPYDGERRPGAVGQPLPGVDVRLRSESGLGDVQVGEPGEIQVRGPNVFHEYWDRPEATIDSFDDGWFRTGDIAVVEDGYYRIMGRNSVDIIKSGGYKLSALEIESVLLDHPLIAQCAVIGVPDDTWGESVAVAVVLSGGESLTSDDLKSWCRERLSKYKIPRHLRLVDELPRNAMGKVTKPQLVTMFVPNDPSSATPESSSNNTESNS